MSNIREEETTTSSSVQRRGQTRTTTRTVEQAKPMSYTVKDVLPDDPDFILLFEGLLWFLFHGEQECEVAIHNSTHSGIRSKRHHLVLKVWTRPNCQKEYGDCPPEVFHIGNPKNITGIQIDVNKPKYPGVFVYQKDSGGMPVDDDWRWVIDFEKDPLYPMGIKLNSSKVNPGLWINHGYFYTLVKTTKKFQLRPFSNDDCAVGGDPCGLPNYVALLAGGNIYLDDGGDVTLMIRFAYPRKPCIVKLRKGTLYQIDIRNVCYKNDKPCPEETGSTDNDFRLYNETFKKPSNKPFYFLYPTERRRAGEALSLPHVPADLCFDKHDREHIDSSNEAPCGPVGAGGGGGG